VIVFKNLKNIKRTRKGSCPKKKVKIIKKAKTTHKFTSQIINSENDCPHLTDEDIFDEISISTFFTSRETN